MIVYEYVIRINKQIIIAMKNKIIIDKVIILFLTLCFATNIAAQDYQFTLQPRRNYDKIKVEIWAKSLNENAPKLGNASLVLQYNTAFLYPSLAQDLIKTDSIIPVEANSPSPYVVINTDYNSANGYNSLSSTFYATGFYSLEINHNELTIGGLQPKTDGRGSFLGAVWFDIVGNPSETDLANIQWSKSTFPGNIEVYDANGNNIKPNISFIDPDQTFQVIGITFLSPINDKQVINRSARYNFLDGAYFDAGYPIYFERSINPEIYLPISNPNVKNLDSNVAYLIEYSLDNGSNWLEIGRASESDKNAKGNNYSSGDIFEPKANNGFIVTSATGQQLGQTNFRLPVRIIWKCDPYFIPRSELTKLKITQLNEKTNTAITNRTASNIQTVSPGTFTVARLFFIQLNGNSNYLKTNDNYSNATQLTVAVWINLNAYQNYGSNPAIVASSGGTNSTPTFGSNEGAWMLYLENGRVPAFRCREILNRGDETNPNYLAIVKAYYQDSLQVVPAVQLTDEHTNNWTHIAATVKDNVVTLYINGEIVNQVTNNNANDIRMLVTNHPIWIGVNPNTTINSTSFINAGIKQVQIWRTALTQEQIRLYATGITNPNNVTSYDEIKKGLEMYYTFDGTKTDLANNTTFQNGEQQINFYDDASLTSTVKPIKEETNNYGEIINEITTFAGPNNDRSNYKKNLVEINNYTSKGDRFLAIEESFVNYRPDQAHLILSSPSSGAGVLNKQNENTEIRWLSFGMNDINRNLKQNYQIEYSIDGGDTWSLCKNPSGNNLSGNTITDVQYERGYAIWQPYQNNISGANLRTINPYSRQTQLRIKGLNEKGDVNFISYSDSFIVAPLFSIRTDAGSQLITDRRVGMNITNDYAYIEAWIKPYKFPAANSYYVIAEKSNSVLHYSFRLNYDGSLGFIVQDLNGGTYAVRTSSDNVLVAPNSIEQDSAWTHCAVLFIKSNENNISEARFYIDGNMEKQLYPQVLQLNTQNDFPLYVGSNIMPINSFVGEIKEVRFWNNIPNNLSIYGIEPTDFTLFVQKSQAEAIDDLLVANKNNLHSYFKFDGGTFFSNGSNRVVSVSEMNGVLLKHYGTSVRFVPFKPFIKLVEPQFRQSISNTDKNVKVRWVGMYYNGLNFTAGAKNIPPSLEYSIRGGGGNEIQPYQYVGSLYYIANREPAIKLPTTNDILSNLTNNKKYVAMFLDASMANPDVNRDGNFVDQGALSPVLTNARLRLTTNFTLNNETLPLQSEGPLFTINPLSNFTLRVMLEGYHNGNVANNVVNNIGTEYDRGGLRIKLYTDNSGEIGQFVSQAQSTNGYTERSPTNLNKGNMRFGNVDFVFTDIADGSYWVVIEHINHLPIMSRYPAPFTFTGDIPLTWAIESGWDFMSWNGIDDNIMTSPNANIYQGGFYSARGNAINNPNYDPERYSTTGLIHTGGTNNNNKLSGMVGGDVNQDKVINAADRVIVRQETGTMSYRADITGDRFVNAIDRTIVDKNYGKVSSLVNISIPPLVNRSDRNITLDESIGDILKHKLSFASTNNDNKNPIEANKKENNIKNRDELLAFRYEVSTKCEYNDSGYVDLSMFIRNQGDVFAPANCTFPVSFDTNQVEFMRLLGADSVIFNSSFDYNNLDSGRYSDYINKVENSYLQLYSAPRSLNSLSYRDIRTIEIDYDLTENMGGINCPGVLTYLGTLRFRVKQGASVVSFSWHQSRAVLTTKGEDITDSGIWDTIPNILLYTGKILAPNGGEKYSILSSELIKWTANKDALVYLEFSSNNGYSWNRLNDSSISSLLKEYNWVSPNITSNLCLVRIVDATTLIELDRSDSIFSIIMPWGNILKPFQSDEVNRGGASTTIEWVSGGVNCTRFEFSSDGGLNWSEINGTSNALTGKRSWSFPRVTTKNALVRMFDCNSGILLSTSGKFVILNGNINFISPTQGQQLRCGNKFVIRWTKQYVDEFDLHISYDNGRSWVKIEEDITGNNYDWIVPDLNTDSAYFKALYKDDSSMEYSRSKYFRIRGCTHILNDFSVGSYIGEVYPNPTKNNGSIKLYFDNSVNVSVELISLDGSKIFDIIENEFIAGERIINFDLHNLVSGKYYLFIKSGDYVVLREVIVGK